MSLVDAEGTEFAERLNEGRIVASLRHPHIITIYDIGATDDILYIAMEYVDGGDLKSRLDGPLPPHVCLELLARIGGALELAHRQGIIHRDVKPANILFRRDGTPLLSDFGIAKQIKLDAELTSTGTILGSPFYMSPEQSEGRVVDGRTGYLQPGGDLVRDPDRQTDPTKRDRRSRSSWSTCRLHSQTRMTFCASSHCWKA